MDPRKTLPLADFLPNAFRVTTAQMETEEPLVLTIGDDPVLVVQNYEGYRALLGDEQAASRRAAR